MARSILPSALFPLSKITAAIACLSVVGTVSTFASINDVYAFGAHAGEKASVKRAHNHSRKHIRGRFISERALDNAFISFGHRDKRTVIAVHFGNQIAAEDKTAIRTPKADVPFVRKATVRKPFKKGTRKTLSQSTLKITGLQLIAGGKRQGHYSKRPKLENYVPIKSGVAFVKVAKPVSGLRLIAGNRHNNNGVKIGKICKNTNFCIVSNNGTKTSKNFGAVKVASVPSFSSVNMKNQKLTPQGFAQAKTKQKISDGPRVIKLDESLN